MCGRYVYMDPDYIQVRFATKNPINEAEANYNVAPGSVNPTISRQSPNKIVMRKWGLVPHWAKDPRIGYKMINARSETVAEKPSFRQAYLKRRCLVPGSGYYEWKREGVEKQPYFCKLDSGEMFGMAGLYEMWVDAEGVELVTYTIITREAVGKAAEIHDRMPVIIPKKAENEWLSESTSREELKELMKNSVVEVVCSQVSKEVNDVSNNSKEMMNKIT